MSDPIRDIERAEKSRGTSSSSAKEDEKVLYWKKEIDLSQKRVKRFRESAKRVTEIYECARRENNSFNILYANTETLLPACYNQLPRPFVKRRYDDADPVAKAASETLERSLAFLQDTGDARYEDFDTLMQQSVLSALVPGSGLTWFKYDADISVEEPSESEEPTETDGEITGLGGAATDDAVVGETKPGDANEKVDYETVCGEDMAYDDILFGYAKAWSKMPWVARAHDMSAEDAEDNFGKETADKLTYVKDSANKRDAQTKAEEGEEQENNKGAEPTCLVYEIWVKSTRKVIFLAPTYPDGLVDERDDPLGLSGFFPCPQPLQFLLKKSSLVPTPIYLAYEQQAKELNRVSMRINKLIEALKIRGFYDGTVQGLKTLLSSEDNTLIAAKNVPAMQDLNGLDKAIWFFPVEKLINVLQQLYVQREQCKNTIYEITGISDIMRGDTQASETYGAQKLKSQWGTARLQRMQRMVQRYVRECLRIMGEIASKHFSLETFDKMTDLDFATPDEIKQAQAAQQQMQTWMAQNPAPPAPPPGGPPPMPGTPPPGPGMAPMQAPPPPQPPANLVQAAQQAQATMAKMPWGEVVKLLQDDLLRDFHIDIETNSTLDANSNEDKQNITEALTALSNMFTSFLPAVQQGAMTMPALKEMTLTVMRKFQFGREVEDAVASMPDQLPPNPNDAALKQVQQQQQSLQQATMAFEQQQAAAKQKLDEQGADLSEQQAAIEAKKKEISNDIATGMKAIQDAIALAAQNKDVADKKQLMEIELRLEKAALAQESRLAKAVSKVELSNQKAKMTQETQAAKASEKGAKPDAKVDAVVENLSRKRKFNIKRGTDGRMSALEEA